MGTLTSTQIDNILTTVTTLEADYKSDLKTFLGTKQKNGGPWSGTGITTARRIQSGLNASGPVNEVDAAAKWKEAWVRVGKIVQ